MFNRKGLAAAGAITAALALAACSSSPSTVESDQQSTESVAQSESAPQSESESQSGSASGATVSQLQIEADGHTIPATLVVPEGASKEAPVPAIVMLHGTGSQKDEAGDGYVLLADHLAEAGIASIRIDYMGAGESTAKDEDFDVQNAFADAASAIDTLELQPEIDANQIGILGWSQGGIHALNAASQDARIKSVVTWAAPSAPMEVTEEQRKEAAEKGYYTTEFDWRDPMDTGQSWIDGMDSLNMESVVSSITVPVLLINGQADDVVTPDNADKLHGWAKDSEVLIIPAADHTFNIFTGDLTSFSELMDATTGFFADTLK